MLRTRTFDTVDMLFLERAPVRGTVRRRIAAPPERVFGLLADAASWPRWLTVITAVEWLTAPPRGVGARRRVHMGRFVADEEFLAWDPDRRLAFRFVRGRFPMVRALAEDYRITPLGPGSCELAVGFALTLPRWLAPAGPLVARGYARGVDRYLRAFADLAAAPEGSG